MTSARPYLLRAIYDWIVDNSLTPHIVVTATGEDVQVPRQFVQNGIIVLNIAPSAVRDLALGNDTINFSARFAGNSHYVSVPLSAVQAIYARENGQGLTLGEMGESSVARPAEQGTATPGNPPTRPSHLTIVK
jgi:stringent starvation protein B